VNHRCLLPKPWFTQMIRHIGFPFKWSYHHASSQFSLFIPNKHDHSKNTTPIPVLTYQNTHHSHTTTHHLFILNDISLPPLLQSSWRSFGKEYMNTRYQNLSAKSS